MGKFLRGSRRPKTTTKTSIPSLPTLLQAPVTDFLDLDAKEASILADKLAKVTALHARWEYENTVEELLNGEALIARERH